MSRAVKAVYPLAPRSYLPQSHKQSLQTHHTTIDRHTSHTPQNRPGIYLFSPTSGGVLISPITPYSGHREATEAQKIIERGPGLCGEEKAPGRCGEKGKKEPPVETFIIPTGGILAILLLIYMELSISIFVPYRCLD